MPRRSEMKQRDPHEIIVSVRIPRKLIEEMDKQISKRRYRSRKEILLKAIKNYNGEKCRVPHGNKKLTSFKLNKGVLRKIKEYTGIKRSRSKVIREALAQLLVINEEALEKPLETYATKNFKRN